MRSDLEILDALGQQLGDAGRSALVARLLRVPQAWAYLREADHFEHLAAADLAALTPADLARRCLGWTAVPDNLSLQPSLHARADALWPDTGRGDVPGADLQTVAMMAVGLLRLDRSEGPQAVADWVLGNPAGWLAPLACALPHIADRAALLHALVEHDGDAGLQLAARCLLTISDPDEAAHALLDAAPGLDGRLLASIDRFGEVSLAQALSRALAARHSVKGGPSARDSLEAVTQRAIALRLEGNAPEAIQVLEQAWQVAAGAAAEVADQMAEAAEQDGDTVTSLEARRQAVRSQPTALRRAALAKTLADSSQEQLALQILADPPASAEEEIAAGYSLARMGGTARAADHLLRVWQSIASGHETVSFAWWARLSQALHAAGQVAAALESYARLLAAHPTDARARLAGALLLAEAGDPAASAEEASLVLSLSPQHPSARRLLASDLQTLGRFAEARAQWEALSLDEPSAAIHAAACALGAGETQAAVDACRAQLQSEPDSAELKVLLARSMAAQGMPDEATAALAEIVERSPETSPAWIALADICEATGDAQAAEATLRRAALAAPDRADVQAAWGDLLRRIGRPGEALRPLQAAVALEPSDPLRALALGDLHRSLGNSEEALRCLKFAVDRRPRDLTARVALASVLEQSGRLAEAAKLIDELPTTAPAGTFVNAGRILVRSAVAQSRPELAEHALDWLDQARQRQPEDAPAAYWQAQALELLGHPADALESYRSCAQRTTDPKDELRLPALVGIARAALALGDIALAHTTLETGREEHAPSAELLTVLAQAHLAEGQPEAAVQAAEQASLLEPDSQDALRALRRAALDTGRTDLALRALQRLVALRPGDSQAWIELAESGLQTADLTMARSALSRALLAGRDQPGLLRRAASVYRRMDDPKRAQLVLRRAVRLDPQDPACVRQLAQASELAGDAETTVQSWLTAAALEPGNAEPFVRAARALEGMSRWNAACDVWQKAVELLPESPAILAGLAHAYHGTRQVRPALDAYARAVALDPANAELLHEAGSACLDLKAYGEAADLLEKAAFLAPHRAELAIDLAEVQFHLGRTADCTAALDQGAAAGPLPTRGLALRALCLAERGELPEALECFAQASSHPGNGADDALWLAKAGLRLGRWQEAEHALRSALESAAARTDLRLAMIQTRLQSITVGWTLSQLEARTHARQAGLPLPEVVDSIAVDLAECGTASEYRDALDAAQKVVMALRDDAPASGLAALATDAASWDDGLALPAAVALLRAAPPQLAVDLLQRLAAHHGASPLSALLLGLSLSLQGRSTEARVAAETARLDPVLRPAADALAARTWLIEQKAEQATAALNAALAAWPDEIVWHAQLASLYLQAEAFTAALSHLQQVVEADPANADAALALARSLRRTGQAPEAEQAFSHALELLPDQPAIWEEAGQVALLVGDAEQALTWFERACTLSPSDGHCLIGAARAAMACGMQRQAAERAKAAARLSPSDPHVLLGLGEILELQGRAPEALQAFDRALASATDLIPVHLSKGRLLVKLGRAQEAADNLRSVLTETSNDDRAWIALAEISESTHDLDTALRAAANAVRIAPRNPAYHHRLGRLARLAGQLDQSLDELRKAETYGEADAGLLIEIGRTHEDRREHALALDSFERAIVAEPQSAEAHFLAGVALKRLKAYARAGRMLKKAVDLNPKDPEAHHQLAAVRALELVHGGLQQATVHP